MLQKYHFDVVHTLFSHNPPLHKGEFCINFISVSVRPSAFLVKNVLDRLFVGSDAFKVTHEQSTIFRTFVASNSIKGELTLRSPITLPGFTLHLSTCNLGAQNIKNKYSNSTLYYPC
jgi:hypothetical protein